MISIPQTISRRTTLKTSLLIMFLFLLSAGPVTGCKKTSLENGSSVKDGPVIGGEYTHFVLSDSHLDPRDFLSTQTEKFDAKSYVETGKVPGNYSNSYSSHTQVFSQWVKVLTSRLASTSSTAKGYTLVFNGDPYQRAPFEKSITPEQRVEAMRNFGDVLSEVASRTANGKSIEIVFNFGDHDLRKSGAIYGEGQNGIVDPVLQKEPSLAEALKETRAGKPEIRVVSTDPRVGAFVKLNGGQSVYLRHIQFESSTGIIAQASGGMEGETTEKALENVKKRLPTLFEPVPAGESVSQIAERARSLGVTGPSIILTSDSHMPVTDTITTPNGEVKLVGTGTMSSSAKGNVPNTIVELSASRINYLAINAEFKMSPEFTPLEVRINGPPADWNPKSALLESKPDAATRIRESGKIFETIESNRRIAGEAPVDPQSKSYAIEFEKSQAQKVPAKPIGTATLEPKISVDPLAELESLGGERLLQKMVVQYETSIKEIGTKLGMSTDPRIRPVRPANEKASEKRLLEMAEVAKEILEKPELKNRLAELERVKLEKIIIESRKRR